MATTPLLLLGGCAAGVGILAVCREPLSHTWDPLHSRYFLALALFTGTALVPAGLVLYGAYPDWSLMYFIDPVQVPTPLGGLTVFLTLLSAPLGGFLAAHRLLRTYPLALRWSLHGLGALFLLLMIGGWDRVFTVAHYDAYHHGGLTVSLFRSPLLVALLLIVPAVLASYVFTILLLRRSLDQELRLEGEGNLPSSP